MTVITDLPEIRPSLLLDFANAGRVDPRIQCVRASTATCIGRDGKLRAVAANVPRVDYNPETGRCLGLLVEEARTNLLTYSEQFESGSWSKARAAIISNAATAPDGTMTADKLVENTENSSHYVVQVLSLSVGVHTYSVYLKAAERTQASIRFYNTNGAFNLSQSAIFNLTAGVVTAAGSEISATIQSVGNGWYRCSATRTVVAAASANIAIQSVLNNSETTQGSGVEGLYLWGAQLESGGFPTSYISTTTAAVTRAADRIWTDLPFALNAGALVLAATPLGWSGADARLVALSDGTTSNVASLHLSPNSGGSIASVITAGGVFQYGPVEGAILPLRRLSRAITWGQATARVATNGVLAVSGSIASPSPMNRLDIGNRLSAQFFSGHIERFSLYPVRLTDGQIQRLTA